MTLSIQSMLWGEPLQPTPANDDLRSITQDLHLNKNLKRIDRTFFALSSLTLPDVVGTYGGDLTAHLTQIWHERIEMQHLYLLMKQTWFADFTHLSIALGIQISFLTFYSQYFADSLNDVAEFAPRTRSSVMEHSLRCMR